MEEVAQASPFLGAVYSLIVALGVVPALWAAIAFGLDFRRAKFLVASILLFCLSVPLSLLSLSDLSTVSYVLLIDYVFACAILVISTNCDPNEVIRHFFIGLLSMLTLAMVAVLIDHDYFWGRLVGRTAPNYWGGVALITLISTLALRSWLLKLPLIALSLFVMFQAQSRADMLALVAGCVVVLLFPTNRRNTGGRTWLLLGLALAVVAAVAVGSDFIADRLLKLSDPGRGVGSGLTGRTDSWREGWELFASHPWLGLGYRQHEQYMTTAMSVHNVYLATLADIGVVGFLGYAVFFFGALFRALTQVLDQPTQMRVAVLAFLTAFTVLGLVEPSGVHTGNTLSMTMIMLAAWAWRVEARSAKVHAPAAFAVSPIGRALNS